MIKYFQINFIHRKFSLISSDFHMDEREFSRIIEISIYDLFYEAINKVIRFEPVVYSPWVTEKKKPPKINIIQILNIFKLPLLEDYTSFLITILEKFQADDQILQVIDSFP